jgi:hypothetical protein
MKITNEEIRKWIAKEHVRINQEYMQGKINEDVCTCARSDIIKKSEEIDSLIKKGDTESIKKANIILYGVSYSKFAINEFDEVRETVLNPLHVTISSNR